MRCLRSTATHRYATALELRAALLEPSTLHEADDLTVATAVDADRGLGPSARGPARRRPRPHRQPAAPTGAGRCRAASARWVRPTLAAVFVVLALVARRHPDRRHQHRPPAVLVGRSARRRARRSTARPRAGADPTDLHIQSLASFDPGAGHAGRERRPAAAAPSTATPPRAGTPRATTSASSARSPASAWCHLRRPADLHRLDVASPTQGWAAAVYVAPSAEPCRPRSAGGVTRSTSRSGINGDASFDLGGTRARRSCSGSPTSATARRGCEPRSPSCRSPGEDRGDRRHGRRRRPHRGGPGRRPPGPRRAAAPPLRPRLRPLPAA